ncbi:MAG: phage gp6-like head-tail connector protein [Planctomycetota bacterium]|nr:MAG: phage gp6-like head-tail connector protein [Planctomycetota bacterium]
MPALAKLVTLTQAKAQLEITLPEGDPSDVKIQDMLNEAESTILNYLKGANGAAAGWVDPITAPGEVTQAIKVLLTWFHERRGDDDEGFLDVWRRIEILLWHWHTPGVA